MLRRGQSSAALLDATSWSVLADLAYAILTENMDNETRAEFDAEMVEVDSPIEPTIKRVQNFRGEWVNVTASRQQSALANGTAMAKMAASRG